ncbi:hypothetical protein TNCT_216951 [Trichonephila clavata]|uniref:Uncharacterized protein n=1 Tax=Trichonephila clavata TaxID=2740835 RepID=A0A8X6JKP8_TRICU|nr:hypothetical protein TNCT_216951 [Trichonephila clavata]
MLALFRNDILDLNQIDIGSLMCLLPVLVTEVSTPNERKTTTRLSPPNTLNSTFFLLQPILPDNCTLNHVYSFVLRNLKKGISTLQRRVSFRLGTMEKGKWKFFALDPIQSR